MSLKYLLFSHPKEKIHLRFGIIDTEKIPFIDRKVSEIFIHPNYKKTEVKLGFDIALLKLDRSINFQKNILPICMPSETETFTSK